MSKAGRRLLEGAREALAVAKGEQPAAAITVNGHTYMPLAIFTQELIDARNKTASICIDCVESLKENSQGLTLDPDTIDACATILRNMTAMAKP